VGDIAQRMSHLAALFGKKVLRSNYVNKHDMHANTIHRRIYIIAVATIVGSESTSLNLAFSIFPQKRYWATYLIDKGKIFSIFLAFVM
jgi:hypothetical protein